jgi:DNA-binding transcriptional ArsR family regulator
MGLTKTENFTQRQNQLAAFAKALGHPARIAIVEYLLRHNSCICGDLVDELPLSQSTVSQHLKELKQIGIIKGEIEGVSVCYCIDPIVWNQAREILTGLLSSQICQPNDSCC